MSKSLLRNALDFLIETLLRNDFLIDETGCLAAEGQIRTEALRSACISGVC